MRRECDIGKSVCVCIGCDRLLLAGCWVEGVVTFSVDEEELSGAAVSSPRH